MLLQHAVFECIPYSSIRQQAPDSIHLCCYCFGRVEALSFLLCSCNLERANGLRYPLVGETRQPHFDGTNFKPRKVPENPATPTSRVHAVLGGKWNILCAKLIMSLYLYHLHEDLVIRDWKAYSRDSQFQPTYRTTPRK